jgi:hypothetical protein
MLLLDLFAREFTRTIPGLGQARGPRPTMKGTKSTRWPYEWSTAGQ